MISSFSGLGLDMVKDFEGVRYEAYDDLQPNVRITDISQVKGTLTIGYGHTHGVYVGQTISEDEAIEFLKEDMMFAEMELRPTIKVPVTQNMYDALISLVFNIGINNFAYKQYGNNEYVGSTLLHKLNSGNYIGASNHFGDFVKSKGVVLQGLVDRRENERKLFVKDMAVLQYFDVNDQSITQGLINETVDLGVVKKNDNSWLWIVLGFIFLKKFL